MEEALATLSPNTAARRAAMVRQLELADLQNKDKDTAAILEFIAGFFGLLGIGHMYVGLTNAGVARLLGYWVILTVMWFSFFMLGLLTGGVLLCCFPLPLLVQALVPAASAFDLRKVVEMAQAGESMVGGDATLGGYLDSESRQAPEPPLTAARRETPAEAPPEPPVAPMLDSAPEPVTSPPPAAPLDEDMPPSPDVPDQDTPLPAAPLDADAEAPPSLDAPDEDAPLAPTPLDLDEGAPMDEPDDEAAPTVGPSEGSDEDDEELRL